MKKRSIPLYYYPVAILFVALFTLSALPATAQTVIELPATADVNVAASTPGRNFGTCDELWVGAAFTRRTLIKFDLSLLPSTSTINSATLSLYQYGTAGADTLEVNIHKINNSWIEGTGTCSSGTSGITWTGHTASGFFETSISANTKISSTPGDKMINISTALVQDWINTPSNNNGILLKLASEPSSGHRSRRFRSKEAANPAERPKLIIGYNSGFPISRCQGVDMITFTAPAKAGVTYTYSMDLNGLWAGNTINPATGEITFAAGWFGETVITATPSTGDYKVTHTITTKRQLGDLKFENDTSYRCQGAGSAIYMAYVNFPDSVRYSLDEASLDAGNTIDSVTRVVTFVETWSGTSTITARAYGCIGDNLGTKIATHKVITQNNLMAIEDRVEMFQGETAQIDVMKNDVCDFDPDKLSILTPPQFGAATLIGTGVNRKIQYKPNSPFFYGTDTLTYRICNTDETACDTATVYINVKQDVTEVCIGATLPKTFYLPFPENASQLRKA
ncbi:MAG: DNRLRE domain-containing protein [Porphyromonadaceae bacterium]|nr:DNRLRE domain-containing protein [Porphyromonadaceae bacterium]